MTQNNVNNTENEQYDKAFVRLPHNSPYFDVSSNKMVYPNILQNQFMVAVPNIVWTLDIIKIMSNVEGKSVVFAEALIVVDLGDGRVVAHGCKQSWTGEDVVQLLTPHLYALQISARKEPNIIIHSDRGTQFTSKVYYNLSVVFDFVILSHSGAQKPTQNVVSERLQKTLFRNDRFWLQLGYPQPDQISFTCLEECVKAVEQIVRLYNTSFQNQRSLGFTPEGAAWAFMWADEKGLRRPEIKLCANVDTETSLGFKEVSTYRNQVIMLAHNEIVKPPTSLEEVYQRSTMQYTLVSKLQQEAINQQNAEFQSKVMDTLTEIRSLAVAPPRKEKKKHVPRPPRSAFDHDTVNDLINWAMLPATNLVEKRDALAAALLYALGIRCSELLPFELGTIQEILDGKIVNITNKKCNRKEAKVAPLYLCSIMKPLFDEILGILKISNYNIGTTNYFFANFDEKLVKGAPNKTLNEHWFNTSVNNTLSKFSAYYREATGKNVQFKSHSGRIGFVTQLIENGADIRTVQKLVGHKDLNSTITYDKSFLSESRRIKLINKFLDKNKSS